MRRRPRREGDAGTATSLDLFGDLPTLRWLPGETAYSLAARCSIAVGIVSPSSTSKILFGYRRGGFPHALPGGIGHFARVFKGALGASREIIRSHTIAPQLVVARTPAVREATYATMEGMHARTLKADLGLLASGFGGDLPLKACPVCLDEDERVNGFSYWRVSQQLPGTWVCSKHATLLESSMTMRSGRARYSWLLPKRDDLISSWEGSSKPDQVIIRRLARLAAALNWLLAVGQRGGLEMERLSALLWDRLSAVDLAHHRRRLRSNQAAASFFQFFGPVRFIPELARVAATPSVAYSQLLAVLNGRANGFHPIRIASLVAWLFPADEKFTRLYDHPNVAGACSSVSQRTTANPFDRTATQAKFLRLITSGRSVSASARQAGVEVATGQTWAAAAGISVPRRASIIKDSVRSQLIEALRGGTDKTKVAVDLKLSASSVGRILRTEPGLLDAWRIARLKEQRRSMRNAWRQALAVGGRANVARAIKPAVYAWLYRNDETWLKDANRATNQRRSNNSATDWQQRDEQLSTDVLRTAEAMFVTAPERLRLFDLLAKLPALKRNLPNLRHLPRTDHALNQVLRRRRRSLEPDLFSRPAKKIQTRGMARAC